MIDYYLLKTKTNINPADLYSWKSAISNRFKNNKDWHNHEPESGKSVHAYPKVQLKMIRGCLAILAIEEQKDTLLHFASQLPSVFSIESKSFTLEMDQIKAFQWQPTLLNHLKTYQTNNLLPFDSDSFRDFSTIGQKIDYNPASGIIEQPELLLFVEKRLKALLVKHLEDLNTGINIEHLHVKLLSTSIIHRSIPYYKDTYFSFLKNVNLAMNIDWPYYFGIGKGSAIGFGVFRQLKT